MVSKKLMSILMSVVLVVGLTPLPAFAADEGLIAGDMSALEDGAKSGTWGTCAWELSDQGVLTIHPGTAAQVSDAAWRSLGKQIKSIVLKAEGGNKVVLPEDCAKLFSFGDGGSSAYNNALASIDLSGVDFSQVKNMSHMFNFDMVLESIAFPSDIDTSHVTNMTGVFGQCPALKSLDLSHFNTSNVTNMSGMFGNCSGLKTLDVTSFDTKSVTNMARMFGTCSGLTAIDVSKLDTSNVTDMSSMFSYCSALKSIDISSFNTSKVTNMSHMFRNCTKLESVNLGSIDTSHVTKAEWMFTYDSALKALDLSAFSCDAMDASHEIVAGDKGSSLYAAFMDCDALVDLKLGTHVKLYTDCGLSRGHADGKGKTWVSGETSLTTADLIARYASTQKETVAWQWTGPEAGLERFGGNTRFDTARMIVDAELELGSYKGAIIVAGDNQKFPDALSAAGLSGVLDYPIVMVDGSGSELNSAAKQMLDSLVKANGNAKLDLIIVGGPNAVSEGIEKSLSTWGTVSERIEGATRYETNANVYDYGANHGGWSTDEVFIATGVNFPDALAIAPYLVYAKTPIVLVNDDTTASNLPGQAREAVSKAKNVVALGGTAVVSDDLLNSIAALSATKAKDRLKGNIRYQTGAAIVKWELDKGMKLEGAGVATGVSFPDALASGFLLGKTGSVLVLASPNASENADTEKVLKDAKAAPSKLRVLGGVNAVADTVAQSISKAAGVTSSGMDERK